MKNRNVGEIRTDQTSSLGAYLFFRSSSKDYQLSKFRRDRGISRDGHADRSQRGQIMAKGTDYKKQIHKLPSRRSWEHTG